MRKLLIVLGACLISINIFGQSLVTSGMTGAQVRSTINGWATTLYGERDTIRYSNGYNLIYGQKHSSFVHTTSETGWYNTALGIYALPYGTSASSNTAVGAYALYLSNGYGNTAVGRNANSDTSGIYVTAIGVDACRHTGGSYNIGIGYQANMGHRGNGGLENIGIGVYSMTYMNGGSYNVGVGTGTMEYSVNPTENTAMGYYAMMHNSGGYSVAIGAGALELSTTGTNAAFGTNSLTNCVTGTNNVALGTNAGFYETGSNKLFIDYTTRASEADGRVKALIYGVFAATPASQMVRLNAVLQLTPQDSAPTDNLSEGNIYCGTDHHIYYYNGSTWKQLDN